MRVGGEGPLPPVVTWDSGSFHPVALQPSCCLYLYNQKLGVRNVCSSRRELKGGCPGRASKAEAPPTTSVPISSVRTKSPVYPQLQGSWAVELLTRRRVSEKGSMAFWWVTSTLRHSLSVRVSFRKETSGRHTSPVHVVMDSY